MSRSEPTDLTIDSHLDARLGSELESELESDLDSNNEIGFEFDTLRHSELNQIHTDKKKTDVRIIHQAQPKTHLKFRGDAVELKHRVKLQLNSGRHRIVFADLAESLDELRFVCFEGASHLLSSQVIQEFQLLKDFEHDRHHAFEYEMNELSESIEKAERKIRQAATLLSGWIPKAREESKLALDEWKEGLALLEQTLLDRIAHKKELEHVANKLKQKALAQAERAQARVQVIHADIEVDREDFYHFELSYVSKSALWKPIYQARLSDDQFEPVGTKPKIEAKLNLEMSARFIQATGESWLKAGAEFCLYPPPKKGFPTLNYPAYERLHAQSYHKGSQIKALTQGLSSPWAGLVPLFSDQLTLNLSLEFDLAHPQPEVMVVGHGKVDTLLPIGGGAVHRFVGDEWIGQGDLEPLMLGDMISLNFGLYAALESCIEVHKVEQEIEAISQNIERIKIAIKNTDHQVRTVLLSQPLSHGRLLSEEDERPELSAPVGWVLSADRKRLMRWLSIAPKRTEHLSVLRTRS